MKKNKSDKKIKHYYIPVFLDYDGNIFVDFNIRNSKNKIIFGRIQANSYYDDKKNQDVNIKRGVDALVFYLEQNGLILVGNVNEMLDIDRKINTKLTEHVIYFFTSVEKIDETNNNSNFTSMNIDDFFESQEIEEEEKSAVEEFLSGKTVNFL